MEKPPECRVFIVEFKRLLEQLEGFKRLVNLLVMAQGDGRIEVSLIDTFYQELYGCFHLLLVLKIKPCLRY